MRNINSNEFNNLTGVALIDFNATWCGPCRMLHPILDELEKEVTIPFYGVDVDDEGDLAERFNITNIPCVIIIKDQKEVGRSVGLKNKQAMLEFIKNNI